MKKLLLGILFFIGFILAVSVSSTFLTNVIGLTLMAVTADKLKAFEA